MIAIEEQLNQAHAAGAAAVHEYPPHGNGLNVFWTRELGANPYDLWTDLYQAWEDGYSEAAEPIIRATIDQAAAETGRSLSSPPNGRSAAAGKKR